MVANCERDPETRERRLLELYREAAAGARGSLDRWFRVDEVRLDGTYPDTELIVRLTEAESGRVREWRHPIWHRDETGEVAWNRAGARTLREISRWLSGEKHDPRRIERGWFDAISRLVARKKLPGALQPRVRLGEVRLEGAYPDTEIVVEVLEGERGRGDIRDRLWRVGDDGEVEFAPSVDFDIVLGEIRGAPRSRP